MRIDKETEKMMRQSTGMEAMQSQTGIRAFYQCLSSGQSQVMVMEGRLSKMKQKLLSITAAFTNGSLAMVTRPTAPPND